MSTVARPSKQVSATRVRSVVASVCNIEIVVSTTLSLVAFLSVGGFGNMTGGLSPFVFFTVDSNILVSLTALAVLPYTLRGAVSGDLSIPTWARVSKFVGSVAVALTFATVMLFLGPNMGYGMMFVGPNLYLHLVTPLVAMFSTAVLESTRPLPRLSVVLGVLPMVVYGCVYIVMVVALGPENGGWRDFYGFNVGGLWPVSLLAMLAATFVLSLLLWKATNAVARRTSMS